MNCHHQENEWKMCSWDFWVHCSCIACKQENKNFFCFLKLKLNAMSLQCNSRRLTFIYKEMIRSSVSKLHCNHKSEKKILIKWFKILYILAICRMVYCFAAIGNWEHELWFGRMRWVEKPWRPTFCRHVNEIWIH